MAQQGSGFSFNAGASDFVFNASTTEFVPGGAPAEEPQQYYQQYDCYPEQQPAPQQTYEQIFLEQDGALRFYPIYIEGYPIQYMNKQQYAMFWMQWYPIQQVPPIQMSIYPYAQTLQYFMDQGSSDQQEFVSFSEANRPARKAYVKDTSYSESNVKTEYIHQDIPMPEMPFIDPRFKLRKPREKPKQVVQTYTEVDKQALLQKLRKKTQNATQQNKIAEPDQTRQPVNIVFIGHIDVGKSTICGNILLLTGKIDQRTIQLYEEEAKKSGRDSWWLAYIMDENQQERAKGKTVEVGRAFFNTDHKRFTILDAPGHTAYVPNMIGGTSQADYAALVISARQGQFERGFQRKGQTREHALLAKSLGVTTLVVVVNKMDEPTVQWSQQKYQAIRTDLTPFLTETCGFDLTTSIYWVPISGLTGGNILHREKNPLASWYTGPTLLELLDSLPLPFRSNSDPVRLPISDKTRDIGIIGYGKIETGRIIRGLKVLVMPNRDLAQVTQIYGADDAQLMYANAGENVRFKLKLPQEIDINKGHVICDVHNVCHVNSEFKAMVDILDLLQHKPIMPKGYRCVIHIHTCVEECQVTEIDCVIDIERKKKLQANFARSNQKVMMRIRTSNPICVENFKDFPRLGRFTLRDEGKTIGLGRVIEQITQREEEKVAEIGLQ